MRAPALLAPVLAPLLAAALRTDPDKPVVLLSSFRGNGETGVFFASSHDGHNFTAMKGDNPVFRPPAGEGWEEQSLTRDPSLVLHDGVFHMVWTSGWTGRVFGYARSTDLEHWTHVKLVTPFPPDLPEEDQPLNVWAPEIHVDPLKNDLFVLFSTTTQRRMDSYHHPGAVSTARATFAELARGLQSGSGAASMEEELRQMLDHRTYIVRSQNGGNTFAPARLFLDLGYSVIDPVMRRTGDRWVMVVKQEKGGKNLHLAYADQDLEEPFPPKFSELSGPIVGPHSGLGTEDMVEGPTLLEFKGKWHLYSDGFTSGHWFLATSVNLKKWRDETDKLVMPMGMRHGTALLVPPRQVSWLQY